MRSFSIRDRGIDVLRRLAQLEFALGALILAAIVVLVFSAAVMRFFGHPLIWSVDMAQLLFIWLCFVGAARAMRSKGHIGIDLLVRFLPHGYRLWLEVILSLVIIVFLLLLAGEGYGLARQNWQRKFGDSGISYAWVTLAVPAGCLMLCAALGYNLVKAFRRRTDGETLVYSRSDTEAAEPSEL